MHSDHGSGGEGSGSNDPFDKYTSEIYDKLKRFASDQGESSKENSRESGKEEKKEEKKEGPKEIVKVQSHLKSKKKSGQVCEDEEVFKL